MKKYIKLVFVLILISACNNRNSKRKEGIKDTIAVIDKKTDSTSIKRDAHYSWEAVPDEESNKLIIKKVKPIENDSLSPDILIEKINSNYDHIKLQFVKISHDTIFVKIGNSSFLTQQMGSTGADMYMTEATYNLTELNAITYVHFDFKEGDHASPGTYCRTDFTNIKFSSH